ncbi:MAG: autotransporter outer membrane beta-barrel domain-containing protein, partial [Phascolarctobacterium sp.]
MKRTGDDYQGSWYGETGQHSSDPGGVITARRFEHQAGTRAAMTDSMLAWRANAADNFVRSGELRNGAEEGAWARIYGGSTKYEGNKTDIDSNYYAVQGGFDKEMGDGWTAGMMFDYRDGDGSYTNGAEGEHKMYSLGVYGSKKLADKAYIDLAAKFGTVENDITARN